MGGGRRGSGKPFGFVDRPPAGRLTSAARTFIRLDTVREV
jgi:hypothetical protein